MGICASVMCTCWAAGLIEDPPFVEHLRLDENGFLALDLPYETNPVQHRLFDQWFKTACDHREMEYANEHISNWSGYRSFQQVLATAGWDHFPALKAELPESNDGLTDAAAAAKMLEELNSFIELDNLGWQTVLVDTDTGQAVHEYLEAYNGVFHLGADGIDMGVGETGFFIWRRHGKSVRELFRSMRFEQNLLNRGLRKLVRRSAAEFVDQESGERFRCREGILHISPWPDGRMQSDEGKFHIVYPTRMHVTKRERRASEFDYIVFPLRRLCEAAVETGNPIRWH
jgi:hypothetical protein